MWCGYSIIRVLLAASSFHTLFVCWLVVGLGVDRIVDARVIAASPPLLFDLAYRLTVGVWGVVVVCVGLLVPVSSVNRCRSSTPGLSTQ